MAVATAAAAVLLAAVQQLPRWVPMSSPRIRRSWLSLGGGFSVAFVFLGILPELERFADDVAEALAIPAQGQEVYMLALFGLVAFYGVERFARRSRRQLFKEEEGGPAVATIGCFATYYAVVGYLLWYEPDQALGALALFTLAMAIHFLAIDVSLRAHHRAAYTGVGRWVLSLAVLVGAALGALLRLPDAVIGALLAFLAGGVILVALKEELPREHEGRWLPFGAGALGYAALLLFI